MSKYSFRQFDTLEKLISFILIREGNFNFRIYIDLLIIESFIFICENKTTNLLIIFSFFIFLNVVKLYKLKA